MKLKKVLGRLAARSVRAAASVVAGSAVVAPLAASAAVDYTGTDYAPWSYSAGCVVWRATEGTFHTSTVADVASDGTIGTAYAMTADQTATSWQRFASNQTAYSAPGMVLVYDESGKTAASDAQFSPISFGGLWVKALADETTPYSITGSGTRVTELGASGSSTYFKFDKSFTINRSSETQIKSSGQGQSVTFDIAEGATFTNTSRLNIVGGATLKLTGKGTLAVPGGLDIQGGNQPTALNLSSDDCPVIDGDVTATGTGALFILPAGTAFDTDLDIQVCTGTLTATAGKVMVMIGSAIDSNVYITTSGGKITRLSKNGDYYVTVSDDAQWDTASWSPSVPTGDLTGKFIAINIASGKTLTLPASLQGAWVDVSGGGSLANPAGSSVVLTDVTINGAILNSGAITTHGTTALNGANQLLKGSGLTVGSGTTSLATAGQGLHGNVTINATATLVSQTIDAVWYNVPTSEKFTIEVYGTLDMGNSRWTIPNSDRTEFVLHDGAKIIASGSNSNGYALDFFQSTGKIIADTDGGDPITISAPLRVRNNLNVQVAEGQTVNITGALMPHGTDSREFNKSGDGTLVLSGPLTYIGKTYVYGGTLIFDKTNPAKVTDVILQGGDVVIVGGTETPLTFSPTVQGGTAKIASGIVRTTADKTFEVSEDAQLQIVETVAADGSATVILGAGATVAENVKLYRADGTEIIDANASGDSGEVVLTYAPSTSGKICWLDFEFNGNVSSSGSTEYSMNNSEVVYNDSENPTAIYTRIDSDPWTSENIGYPAEWSAAIRCTVPENKDELVVAFGTLGGGLIGLAKGEGSGDVNIVYTTGNSARIVAATATVVAPTTTMHVYVFTKTASAIEVYCDGKLVKRHPVSNLSFGNAFQVGSVFGGLGNTGLNKAVATSNAQMDFLRLYYSPIGPNMIKQLTKEYPYESGAAVYTRTVAGEENWVAESAWTADGETFVAEPVSTEKATLTASGDAVVTVNLASVPAYEELTFGGEGDIALVAGEGTQPIGAVSIKVNTNVTVPYNLVRFDGADVEVADGKTLTIDYTGLDWSSVIGNAIAVTGVISTKPADGAIVVLLPETLPAFVDSAEFRYDDAMSAYIIAVSIDHAAGAEIYWDASNGQTYWGDGNNAAKFYASYANGEFSNETLYRAGDTVVVPDTTQRWYGPLSIGAKVKFDCGGTIDVSKTDSIGHVFNYTAVTIAEGTTLNFTKSGNDDPVVYGGSVKGAGKIAVGDGVTLTFTNTGNDTHVATEIECTGTGNVLFDKDEFLGAGETFTLKSGAVSVGRNGNAKWFIVNGAGGTINLDGGVLSVCRLTPNAAMNVNFNGGTLKSYGDGTYSDTIVSGDNTTAKVLAGGAIIDTDVYNTSITTALASGVTEGTDGGLVKKGTGTLTLTVVPTFTGAISVEGGYLVLPKKTEGEYNLADGTIVISEDTEASTVTLGATLTLTVPVIEGLSSTVTVGGEPIEGVAGEGVMTYQVTSGTAVSVVYAATQEGYVVAGTATYEVTVLESQTLAVNATAAEGIVKLHKSGMSDTLYATIQDAVTAGVSTENASVITLLKSAEIGEAGLTVNCGGARPVTIQCNEGAGIYGTGAITKQGSGTLTFKGDMSEYTGIVTVNAGTVFVDNGITLNPQQVVVAGGEFKVGAATVNMVNARQAMDFNLNAGSLTMEDGSFLTVGKAPYADAKWLVASAGTAINLNGGVLAVCRLAKWANVAAATVNFNGGTLKSYGVGNSVDSIISAEENSPWTLNVLAGGAIIDTDVDTTISDALISGVEDNTETEQVETDGGLVKKGTGALILAVAPTFTGAVSVEAGALYVPAGATLTLAEGTVKADTSDKEGYDKYVPGQSGTQCEDGSGNNFTVPTTVVVPNEKTLADATGKGTTYAQAYALGLWDGTADGEVADMPKATISIANGVVTVTFTGVSSEAYTVKKWLQEKASLTAAWPETPTEQNSKLIEGDSATDTIGSGEDAQFYRVVVTIEDPE